MKGKHLLFSLMFVTSRWIIFIFCSDVFPGIEWQKVVEGSVLSMGQVYAVQVTPGISDSRLQLMFVGPGDQSAHVVGRVPLQPPLGPPVGAGGGAGNFTSFTVPWYR